MPIQFRRFGRRFLPLSLLPKKIKLRLYRDVLKKERALISVLDFEMEVPLQTPGIGSGLFVYGHRELDQYEILRRELRPNDVVMDIGANIGYYVTIEARLVGENGFIYAFEPDPRNRDVLECNIKRNKLDKRVKLTGHAVSNADKKIKFNIAERGNLSSVERTRGDDHASIVDRGLAGRKYIAEVSVPAVDLANALERTERPVNLIRMDVEGHEVEILGSLATALDKMPKFSRAPQTVIFEPHSWEYGDDHSLRVVLESLARHGYAITYLGTRDESASPIRRYGYEPICTVRELPGVLRGVYNNLSQMHAIELASSVDGVTTVCLQRYPDRLLCARTSDAESVIP